MTQHAVARYQFHLSVAGLLAAIAVVGAFLAIVALPDILRQAAVPATSSPAPSATIGPKPTSPMAGAPIGIAMSPDADCGACHLGSTGAVVTKDIPTLAHPLEGWKDCTACHADDSLVETAPGHSSIHRSDCLTCHTVRTAEGSAPPRPHHIETGKACVTCHGPEAVERAPLPTDMAGRTNCWICHSGTEYDDLFREAAAP